MSLQYLINDDEFAALEAPLQALYQKGESGYALQVSGLPEADTSGLKAKTQELLGEVKAEREKRKALQKQLDDIGEQKQAQEEENAKKTGDLKALEQSYQAKIAKAQEEANAKTQALQKQIYELTVGAKASAIANELAVKGSDIVLLPHIIRRLTLEADGDGQKIRVLDERGEISALTIEDLKNEFRTNPAFAAVISAGFASGSGAVGGEYKPQTAAPKSFAECKTDEQKLAWLKAQGDKS